MILGRKMNSKNWSAILLATSILTGCGGSGNGGGNTPPPAVSYYGVGGTITGLNEIGLILANGDDTITPIANATSFQFGKKVALNSSYSVAIKSQPIGLKCNVGGTFPATMGANDVTNLTVSCTAVQAIVTTFAGSGAAGNTYGSGTAASFNLPEDIAVDGEGNVYVADKINHMIRKITSAGDVSILAGSGVQGYADGTGSQATFNMPIGVAVDSSGYVYVADALNHAIRKISPAGIVSTLAGSSTAGNVDGTSTSASFNLPSGVAVDSSGNVYVADSKNHSIRKISVSGVVTTLAGNGSGGSNDGVGAAASFYNPSGVAVDIANNVYVADSTLHKIRKITAGGLVSTLAGSDGPGSVNGIGTNASFFYPSSIAVDRIGNLYVTDSYNHLIRRISTSGLVSTLAGTGLQGNANGVGVAASFYYPNGIAIDNLNNIYIADHTNNLIRKITFQ
jgi:serine/threonine-protein kinase